ASADRWNGGENVKASAAVPGQMKLCSKVMPAVPCQRYSNFVPESCDDPVELQKATAGGRCNTGNIFLENGRSVRSWTAGMASQRPLVPSAIIN
ncbi:MAG: hypothetical protein DMF01_01315, partial [Verrucomicrobia bacterium]